MDVSAGSDIRLACLILLSAAVAVSCSRFTRRLNPSHDLIDRAADAFLLFFLIQYLSVCLPGLLHLLSPLSIAITSILLCLPLWVLPRTATPSAPPPLGLTATLCSVFVLAYVLAIDVYSRHLPILAHDALTYHVPAAAEWLQTHSLSLHETWFFNPANTYSPLAGSTFITWLLAPLGDATIAIDVQSAPLIMLFFAATRLARSLGLPTPLAAATSLSLIVTQSFNRASMMPKDDLFVAAFFTTALHALARLSPPRSSAPSDPFTPYRLGISLGLLLATKYTALLTVPILLLAFPSPKRHRKPLLVALLCTVALAAPWYLRNLLLTGNPLFPLHLPGLPGLFSTAPSPRLRSLASIWHIFTGVDDAMPAPVLLAAAGGYLAFLFLRRRTLFTDPLTRSVALGPLIGISLFLLAAPYAEIRFLFPVLILLTLSLGLSLSYARPASLPLILAFALLCLLTGLPANHAMSIDPAALIATAIAAIVYAARNTIKLHAKPVILAALVATLSLAAFVYVYWEAYVEASYNAANEVWSNAYGPDLGGAWNFIRTSLPPDAKLAYANTYLTYPLMGFRPTRPVVYVPTRHDVTRLADLPPFGTVTGDNMELHVAEALFEDPDESQWLARLAASGARYLFITRRRNIPSPPEIAFTSRHPDRFRILFSNNTAVVFEITP